MRDRYICAEHSGHAGRALIGVFSSVYSEKVICDSLLDRSASELLLTDAWTMLVSEYLNTIRQAELCNTAHNPECG
jgi:hypothetical protein